MPEPTRPRPRSGRVTAIAAVLLAALVAWLSFGTVRALAEQRSERHGTLTVSRCDFLTFSRHNKVYRCVGEFVSDAGDLRVPEVSFSTVGSRKPGESVAGTVSGPGNAAFRMDRELTVRVIFTIVGVAVLGALMFQLVRPRGRPGPAYATGA